MSENNELVFKLADLRPLLEHTRAAETHKGTYGQDNARPGLWLVKDSGIYLMSNGDPGLMRPDNLPGDELHHVVYAQGFRPSDAEWWVKARAAVGGDDFALFVPLAVFEELESSGHPIAFFIFRRNRLAFGSRAAEGITMKGRHDEDARPL